MRRITGYIEGRAVWSENQPSSAQPANWFHGTMVTGAPGPTENERKRKRVREREGANAAQRRSYAKKKLDQERANGRPRLSPDIEMRGRGHPYPSEEERIAARRQAWRDAQARKRDTAA